MNRPAKNKSDFRVMIVYPNLFMMLVPSLAVAIFTRLLKNQGYQVELFETTQYEDWSLASPENRVKFMQARQFNYEKDLGITVHHTDKYADFRRRVLEFKPDAILISAVEDVFLQAVKLLEQIKDLGIPHILGGVFPTAAGECCLEFPVVQRIARGEGETVIQEFTERVRLGRNLDDIPGTWCRDGNGGICRNANPPLVNINLMRPDFSLFEEARFYRPMGGHVFKTVPVETYRGCPYACTFCNSPMQRSVAKEEGVGNFLRRKTMDNLRDELTEIRDKVNPEFIYFIDDSFLARPKQEIFDFCDMYEKFRLPFWFNTRPENCTGEMLRRLKEVGCYRISFGVECGNEEYRRKVLLRHVSNQAIIESFGEIREAEIPFSINLIIGFPGETRELVMDTVDLVRSFTGYDTLTVSIFTPYHGTHLRAAAVRNGWLDPSTITKHTTSSSLLAMPPPYLSSDDIDGLVRVLPFYCYFPKSEWNTIRRAETLDEEGKRVLKHYQEIYRRNFLRESQEAAKTFIEGGTGCRSNPKDSFFFSPNRLSENEIRMLSAHAGA
jgi:anaerobic magnesium-protoporphyrin IX monomethyl ester cyclase